MPARMSAASEPLSSVSMVSKVAATACTASSTFEGHRRYSVLLATPALLATSSIDSRDRPLSART